MYADKLCVHTLINVFNYNDMNNMSYYITLVPAITLY